MSDLVPVKLAANVKAELETLKVHPAERLSDVVARLLAQRQYPVEPDRDPGVIYQESRELAERGYQRINDPRKQPNGREAQEQR